MLSAKMRLTFVLVAAIAISAVSGKEGYGPGSQDWGHVTVRTGAHIMFYWLYYTTANVRSYTEKPLAIWLQGGPGASSTGYGNFEELGPLDVNNNYRNHTWVKDMNVLFIDNPVGSGYSYVESSRYLTTDNKMIAVDLVSLMKEFYRQHPEFVSVPLHIFSESYGGKMAAEFALELNNAIKNKEISCNFQSVSLGDSWTSPMESVYSWAPLLLHMGIIDHEGHDAIQKAADNVQRAMDQGRYTEATSLWGTTQRVLLQKSGGVDFYNILKKTGAYYQRKKTEELTREEIQESMFRTLVQHDSADDDYSLDRLMNGPVKSALNISRNVVWGSQSSATFNALAGDFMKPVVHIVETLLNTTDVNVNIFSGHLDLICATPGTVNMINKMNWKEKAKYNAAPRTAFGVNGVLEGYSKAYNKFTMYWINRAGHMAPADNPAGMDYVLRKVTKYNQ